MAGLLKRLFEKVNFYFSTYKKHLRNISWFSKNKKILWKRKRLLEILCDLLSIRFDYNYWNKTN